MHQSSEEFFNSEVVEASKTVPVLVDFWAEWCGPCRVIGPVLERLAAEADGAWKLVKINTEEHPTLAQAMQIRSIPAVKLYVDGSLRDEFVGALPEEAIKTLINAALPTEAGKTLEAGAEALARGDRDRATPLLERAVELEPKNTRARTLLASALLTTDPEPAGALASSVEEGSPEYDSAHAVAVLAKYVAAGAPPTDTDSQRAAAETLQAGLVRFGEGDYGGTAGCWLDSLRHSKTYGDSAAKELLVALFTWLGDDHPVSEEYRRQLASALY